MNDTTPLHQTTGIISALTYFVATLGALATFLIFQVVTIELVAIVHLIFVVVAGFSVLGLVYWWISEQQNN